MEGSARDVPENPQGAPLAGGWLPPEPGPRVPVGPPPAYKTLPPPPTGAQPLPPPPAPGHAARVSPGSGNGLAVAGFVLSVGAAVLLVMSLGIGFPMTLPASIAGALLGRAGRRRAERGETSRHRGLGQAGWVVGIVTTALGIAAAVVWIALLASEPGLLEDLENVEDQDDLDRVLDDLLGD